MVVVVLGGLVADLKYQDREDGTDFTGLQGLRNAHTLHTCVQPLLNFGSHFWLGRRPSQPMLAERSPANFVWQPLWSGPKAQPANVGWAKPSQLSLAATLTQPANVGWAKPSKPLWNPK